jgi:hypothetical protein
MRGSVLFLAFGAGALLTSCGSGTAGSDAERDAPALDAVEPALDLPPSEEVDEAEPSPDLPPGQDADVADVAVHDLAEVLATDAGFDTPAPYDVCAATGQPARAFVDALDDATLYATAADFTVETTEGPWNLKAHWTGCETYLFIQDKPRQDSAASWPTALWARDVKAFLSRLPPNVQVFFVPTSAKVDEVNAALALIQGQVETFVSSRAPVAQARWNERVHFVTQTAKAIPGWLGKHFASPGWGVGIDRFQRVRYIGSYADYSRYNEAAGWFEPNLSMAANEPLYYEFEAQRQAALEAENATVVPVFAADVIEDPGWTGVRGSKDVELPDAATLATFDSLGLDLTLNCVGAGEYGECPAWDYDVNLYLCDRDDPGKCDTDIAHWITTYHREGRWVHDVSGLLPLFEGGGLRRLQFYTTQKYEVTLSLRLSNRGKTARPFQTRYLWGSAAFGPGYNQNFVPQEVPVPPDTTKVELMTVITGHGGVQPENCAEFCKTTHTFTVNGHDHVLQHPEAGTGLQCMLDVTKGTVPNQYGTWWYGRNGWCPGREVAPVLIDVTSDIPAGQPAIVFYEGRFNGQPYHSDGAYIRMTSWLVFSK